MKITNLKGIVVPILLTLLMFAAFWLYVEWDRRRFQETVLKEIPAEETHPTLYPTHLASQRTHAELSIS